MKPNLYILPLGTGSITDFSPQMVKVSEVPILGGLRAWINPRGLDLGPEDLNKGWLRIEKKVGDHKDLAQTWDAALYINRARARTTLPLGDRTWSAPQMVWIEKVSTATPLLNPRESAFTPEQDVPKREVRASVYMHSGPQQKGTVYMDIRIREVVTFAASGRGTNSPLARLNIFPKGDNLGKGEAEFFIQGSPIPRKMRIPHRNPLKVLAWALDVMGEAKPAKITLEFKNY